jgi:hypothetical protein
VNRQPSSINVLAWFRRMAALRFVLLVAAVMSAQSAVICACDGVVIPGAQTVVVADAASIDHADASVRGATDEICCASCVDCAQCGGCHVSAVAARPDADLPNVAFSDPLISWTSAARAPWTQPTPSRPPITTA